MKIMGSRGIFCCVLLSFFCFSFAADQVNVTIKGVTSIARTDDNFICATLDWWPSNKCDYNQCPWGRAGIPYLVRIYQEIVFLLFLRRNIDVFLM